MSLPQITLDIEDYHAIIDLAQEMSSLSPEETQKILDKANKTLPPKTRARCDVILENLKTDENLYTAKKRSCYYTGKNLSIAVADYLVKHLELLKPQKSLESLSTNQNP